MKTTTIYKDDARSWVMFGRDPGKADSVIDTNQYLVTHRGKGMLLDPVVEPGRRVHIIYPLGSGALLCCAHKGIEELRRLGLFEGHPVMWGAQPETVAPIIRTWERIAGRKAGGETYKEILPTEEIEPVLEPQEKTIAKSIAIGKPGSGYEVLDIFLRSFTPASSFSSGTVTSASMSAPCSVSATLYMDW